MPRHVASVHIKNLADGVRHEDLRHAFGKFGRVIDVTVPVNYHTGRPKGFAFVEFDDARDAEDAIYHMNHSRFAGREITVEFTRGTRKTPAEMRARDSGSRGRSWRSRSRSRSRSFRRRDRSSRDRSDSYSRRRGGSGRGGRQDDYRQSSRGRSYSRSADAENSTRRDDRESTKNGHWAEERGRRRRSRASSRELSRGSSRGGARNRDGPDARSSPRRDDSRSPAMDRSPSRGGGSRSPSPSRGEEGFSQSPMRSRSISRGRCYGISLLQGSTMNNGDAVDAKAIRKQLEFYFSDVNLSHDGFFRAEVQRNPDASLCLDVLLRCNKLRALGATRDHLLAAAERSKLLEVNAAGTAIRRKTPLNPSPTSTDCIVLATGIPCLQSSTEEEEDGIDQEVDEAEAEELEEGDEDDLELSKSTADNDQIEEDIGANMAAMSFASTIDWLKDRLKEFGLVTYINMPRFKTSGGIRGFGFVEFASKSAAERAVSALAPTEKDLVCSSNLDVNISGRKAAALASAANIPEAGWTPKLAPYATNLTMEERLARQFVWRCCSRRSKQVVSAYRRLFAAGYRMPNPMDAEYRLITEGVFNVDSGGEGAETGVKPAKDRELRLLPYLDWLTWRPRFYAWLRAWTERMRKKANRLIACAERKRRAPILYPLDTRHGELATANAGVAVITSPLTEGVVAVAEEAKSQAAALPANFCSGTVVEVYWPLDEELQQLETRQQMRRVRAAIEHSILQPNRLLRAVAHFDTKPCDCLQFLEAMGSDPIPSTSKSDTVVRVFVRFCGAAEARTFVRLLSDYTMASGGDSGGCFAWGSVLEGRRERAYCATIAAAKAGGVERRRRAQVAKRRRKVGRRQCQPAQSQKPTVAAVVDNGLPKPTRIVFDED
ncbi:Serine/arginine-rich splicing factor 12 [Taenia crassiceps]|uniref:Serine/arginine-rich splicing factor 12 n=1 Tax=Taenia crassiceps TaxID=6207 RepID=A0ABR4QLY2_9CEST